MSDMNNFDNFEKETRMELIRMEDQAEDKGKAKEIIDTLAQKLEEMFEEVKRFAKDPKNKEKVQEAYEKVKTETSVLLDKTKEKVNDVKEDDRVKEFLDSASKTIDGVIQSINENETFHKVKENVSETFENIKNDEKVQKGVKKAKKATLTFAQKALNGIEKALKEDDVVIHDVDPDKGNTSGNDEI